MHYVIETVYSPADEQIGSGSIAEFDTYAEAAAMADKLAMDHDACPPNADENRGKWR